MNDPSRAKVMFPIGGVPMIHHVVERALQCQPDRVVAIIGFNREAVRHYLGEAFQGRVEFAEQLEQLGTGHAVMQAMPLLNDFSGDILVLSGDVPLLSYQTIGDLWDAHTVRGATGTVLTVVAQDPTGYGRVIRNADGSVSHIVEHRDATEQERMVKEINSGIYLFDAEGLRTALANLNNNNAQNEYYLTDVFGYFRQQGLPIAAHCSSDFEEIQGINTVDQLAQVDEEFRMRGDGKKENDGKALAAKNRS